MWEDDSRAHHLLIRLGSKKMSAVMEFGRTFERQKALKPGRLCFRRKYAKIDEECTYLRLIWSMKSGQNDVV